MVLETKSVMALIRHCPSPIHELQDGELQRDLENGSLKTRIIGTVENMALCLYAIDGVELFVAALKSLKTNFDIDLSETTLVELSQIAKENKCQFIRFHTFRPGLVRKALDLGFLPTEFVLRKKLA